VNRNAVLWQVLPLSMLKAEGSRGRLSCHLDVVVNASSCNFRDLLRNCEFTLSRVLRKSGGYCTFSTNNNITFLFNFRLQ
jgi:hypothetical protein